MMFLSFFLGFLSIGLGVSAIIFANILSRRTDQLVKTEDERAKSLIGETQRMIDEGNRRAQEMIMEMQKEYRELIIEMDKRHQETMEYLGSLIKADGEKTRELINKVFEKTPG